MRGSCVRDNMMQPVQGGGRGCLASSCHDQLTAGNSAAVHSGQCTVLSHLQDAVRVNQQSATTAALQYPVTSGARAAAGSSEAAVLSNDQMTSHSHIVSH